MTSDSDFFVRFWGVRGSIACPGPETARYGGNTPCVEVRCGSYVLVFDAGTGLRQLGDALVAHGVTDIDLFLSHTHIDHVIGFPFFCYLFNPENKMRVWSGHLDDGKTSESVMRQLMAEPLFPVPVDIFTADIGFNDFSADETLTPRDGIMVTFGVALPTETFAADALRAVDNLMQGADDWNAGRRAAVASSRLIFGAAGDAANLAAKLEKATKDQKVRAHTTGETYDVAVTLGYTPSDTKDRRTAQTVDGVDEPVDLVVLAA